MEATSPALLGREPESAAIDRLLASARERPSLLVIDGEPGIGKSVLMRTAVARSIASGIPVLAAAPHQSERDLAFAGLGDLLRDVTDATLSTLPGPQATALSVALLRREATGPAPGARGIGLALGGVIDLLVRSSGAVVVAIDDLQWLDRSTEDVVRFALRRLGTRPVGVLLARRRGTPGTLDVALPELEAERLALGPLSLGATHALVSGRTGIVLSRPDLLRFHALTRGNPLHALELGRALRAGRATLAPGHAVPADLDGLMRAHVMALSATDRDLVAAAAATARPTVGGLTAALGERAPASLRAAVAADLVTIERDAVVFRHPLLAAAAYAEVTPERRRQLHARLATTEPDELERARHLALAAPGPDPAVAAVVEAAARRAFDRGAPSAAADLCALARTLTPVEADDDAGRLRLTEAGYRFEAGDTAAADELLEGLLATTADPVRRTQALALQARIRHFAADVAGGVALARDALRSAAPDDPARGAIAEGIAWGLLLMRGDTAEALRHARLAVDIADRHASTVALAEALAALAMAQMTAGQDGSAALERALALEPAMGRLRVLRYPSFARAWMLAARDSFDGARSMLEQLRRRADEQGDDSSAAPLLTHLAAVDLLTGRLTDAVEHARAAAELAHQSGQLPTRVAALGRLALAQVRLGDAAAGNATASTALGLAAGGGGASDPTVMVARGAEAASWALGELAVVTGRPADAVERLGPLADLMRAAGVQEPGETRFLPVLIEALVSTREITRAAVLITWLESMAAASGRASTLTAAAAARGTILAAAGDLQAAAEQFAIAVERAHGAPLPWEAAWTRLRAGRILRRLARKREAVALLAAAEAGFLAIGAAGWAELAVQERQAIGGRSGGGTWTAAERRVAELVAEGATNKEIAARLSVSAKAVEATLSRLYARTGIRSRAELATRYARELPSTLGHDQM